MEIKLVNKSTNPLPQYATEGSAGFDLMYHGADIYISPDATKLVGTGLYLAIPKGYEGQVRSRSGLALKNGIIVKQGIGTIDSDFRGEVKVMLHNLSKQTFMVTQGTRIAQMVIAKHENAVFEQVESLDDTTRGAGGFGSTGNG